jgi:hypothetical protein
MPQKSTWLTIENLLWIEKHRGKIPFNKILNTIIRHAREAAGDTYIQTMIRDYHLEEKIEV